MELTCPDTMTPRPWKKKKRDLEGRARSTSGRATTTTTESNTIVASVFGYAHVGNHPTWPTYVPMNCRSTRRRNCSTFMPPTTGCDKQHSSPVWRNPLARLSFSPNGIRTQVPIQGEVYTWPTYDTIANTWAVNTKLLFIPLDGALDKFSATK